MTDKQRALESMKKVIDRLFDDLPRIAAVQLLLSRGHSGLEVVTVISRDLDPETFELLVRSFEHSVKIIHEHYSPPGITTQTSTP